MFRQLTSPPILALIDLHPVLMIPRVALARDDPVGAAGAFGGYLDVLDVAWMDGWMYGGFVSIG